MLDPFYGVYHPRIARWLNRITLVAEIGVIAYATLLITRVYEVQNFWEWYQWAVFALLASLVIPVTNFVLRKLWDIVLVIVYGTTDADEIVRAHEERLARKREKNVRWEARKDREICLPDSVNGKKLSSGQRLQLQKDILKGNN